VNEDVRPFEEYKEMIKDMRKEEMIKGLYDLSKNITEKGKEIERLQRQKEELQVNGLRQETLFKLEIERLNNIIKEVREMLYKRDKDDYDIYTANVLCDIQSDFEEILRREY
jgi:hypothetical protein